AIEGARGFFNKITEELVDPSQLADSDDQFLRLIAKAYVSYDRLLFETNHIDFAHLQKLLYDLLQEPEIAAAIKSGIKYVLVDEYQDTNYLQEQILFKLAEDHCNLCVVGDEDQSLYRFRGATVRNLLEFPTNIPEAHVIKLTTNYRSHKSIVKAYDQWMASADWSNANGPAFRFDKTIAPDHESAHSDYPAIFSIWGNNERDEAQRLAEFVDFLKEREVIRDYNQVALLLHSVRQEHSGRYLEALKAKG